MHGRTTPHPEGLSKHAGDVGSSAAAILAATVEFRVALPALNKALLTMVLCASTRGSLLGRVFKKNAFPPLRASAFSHNGRLDDA